MGADRPSRAGSGRPADQGAAGAQACTEIEACRAALKRVTWDTASPEHCRKQARRCEALARKGTIEICREAYLRMALCWRGAASQLERREAWTSPARGLRREAH